MPHRHLDARHIYLSRRTSLSASTTPSLFTDHPTGTPLPSSNVCLQKHENIYVRGKRVHNYPRTESTTASPSPSMTTPSGTTIASVTARRPISSCTTCAAVTSVPARSSVTALSIQQNHALGKVYEYIILGRSST